MITTDRQRIAVTSDHKDRQIFTRRRNTGSDRSSTAVNRVHAVGVHVVRETRRATDAGNDHGVLALDPQLRHEALERGEDCVVATAWTPTDLLITGEVLTVQRLE